MKRLEYRRELRHHRGQRAGQVVPFLRVGGHVEKAPAACLARGADEDVHRVGGSFAAKLPSGLREVPGPAGGDGVGDPTPGLPRVHQAPGSRVDRQQLVRPDPDDPRRQPDRLVLVRTRAGGGNVDVGLLGKDGVDKADPVKR